MDLYVDRDAHVKPYLGIAATDTTKNALLDLLNDAATELLNSIMNVNTLAHHTVTAERFDGGVSTIWCKDFPITSVTSITVGRNATAYTQTSAYVLDKNTVLLDGSVGGGTGYEQCKITYDAGYYTYDQAQDTSYTPPATAPTENFPADLKLAVLILIAGLFNQRNNQGITTMTIQGKSVTFRNEIEVKEFEDTISRYRKIRDFAI